MGGGTTLFLYKIWGPALSCGMFYGHFSENLIFCQIIRKMVKMTLFKPCGIGCIDPFFEDENRGAIMLFKSSLGGAKSFFGSINNGFPGWCVIEFWPLPCDRSFDKKPWFFLVHLLMQIFFVLKLTIQNLQSINIQINFRFLNVTDHWLISWHVNYW